jgi:arylsulfatase A-like enzyme
MNAICLIVDGLQASFLGPYGNSWIATPACDRLASQGFVFDQALIDSPRLESIYRSLWSGRHALVKPSLAGARPLADRLAAGGINTSLVTDDALVAEHPWGAFRESLYLRPTEGAGSEAAEDVGETRLARFFAEAIEHVATLREPFLLWIHSRGMTGAWDAPDAIREQHLDEEDEESEAVIRARLESIRRPPEGSFAPDEADPDELLALRIAYAAQVHVFDHCLGALLQALDEAPYLDRTLLWLSGARGFPLGQHGTLGLGSFRLHEELTHIPWIVRLPGQVGACDRTQALVQPADLAVTLEDFLGGLSAAPDGGAGCGINLLPLIRGQAGAVRDRVILSDEAYRDAIRTVSWYLIRERQGSDSQSRQPARVELYVKPDDRWELNEVSVRCGEVTEGLTAALDETLVAVAENWQQGMRPLPESLTAHHA